MMSTYSFEVAPVAMSKMKGIWRVTTWPALLVPVARTVRGYSPGASVPPLMVMVAVRVPLLARFTVGVMLTAPIPDGSTPFDCGPPSMLSVTFPPNVEPPVPVLNGIVPVPVAPVVETAMTVPPPVLEKSRLTLPMLIAWTPTGAPLVANVAHRTVVFGVAGLGDNVIGVSVVPYGFAGSFQSANDVVVTTPANAAFFASDIVTALLRFWLMPIVTVLATV